MINDLNKILDISEYDKTLLNGRFIYFISDINDNIVYIGQTSSLAYRMDAHKVKNEYVNIRAIKVHESIPLLNAEFLYIVAYKPEYNRSLPVSDFLTTKTRITLDGLEKNYNLDSPDLEIRMRDKVRLFWIKDC